MGQQAPEQPPATPPADTPPETPPATPPASPPPPATPPAGESRGYPANTPVADMTPEQRQAYDADKREQNRQQREAWRAATRGQSPEEIAAALAELETLKRERLSESERAVAEARDQVRSEVTRTMATENVRTAFALLLPDDMPEAEQNEAIEVLNLEAFLTSDGRVDTAKVRTTAAKIAPRQGSGTQQRDFGQGRRTTPSDKSGVAAGAEMFAARKTKPPTT
jgi:hypothetical protein